MTQTGRAVRQTAEHTTNKLFYAPSLVLSPSEIETVQSSLDAFGG